MRPSYAYGMARTELDNPVWHSLISNHRCLAKSVGDTWWYPGTYAPFIAIADSEVVPDLDSAVGAGFTPPAYFVGVVPNSLPAGWRIVGRSGIVQMLPDENITPVEEGEHRELNVADQPAMSALTQLAFPDFFRARTAELGLYLGCFDGARLVAMAGERFAFAQLQEISGVCTHPDFKGRGSARRLTLSLMHRHRLRGVHSFLHVSEGNVAARRLYDAMGFRSRIVLQMHKVDRI